MSSPSSTNLQNFEGPPYDDKGEIDKADVKEVLIAEEDNVQRDFDAYNYNKHELNHKVEEKEESIDRVDIYDNDDMILDDMFGYSYFDTFPSFDSFKINYKD